MKQITDLLVEKVGMSEDMAAQATVVVMGFMREKLPEEMSSKVELLLAGGSMADMGGMAEKAKGMLGGIFGGKAGN